MTNPSLQLRRQQYVHPFGHELAELNPDTVVEVLEYLFNTTAWKSNPDLLKRKISQARLRLFTDGPGTLSGGITPQHTDSLFAGTIEVMREVVAADEDDGNAWIEKGIALRMEGAGWTRLAKELEKPRATLRRVIARAMDERGLVAPSTAGDD